MQETFASLLRLLGELKDTLDRLVETVDTYQKAKSSQIEQAANAELKAEVRLPVEVTKYYVSEDFLALLTLLTLIIFNGQLKQMKIQTADAAAEGRSNRRHSREEIRTLQSQADAVQRQMREDERPWVTVIVAQTPMNFPANQPITVPLRIADYSIDIGALRPSVPDFFNFPARQLAPDQPTATNVQMTIDINDDFKAGRKNLMTTGEIFYKDVFETEHWTKFCFMIHPAPNATPLQKECNAYNDFDSN